MGIYLNPGSGKFKKAVNSKIYVDKTGLIEYTNSVLNTEQRYICISRPRRFGKTMTINMLAAYYSYGKESKEIFDEFAIAVTEDYLKYINSYDVITINMLDFIKRELDIKASLIELQSDINLELCATYPDVKYRDAYNLIKILQDIYSVTNRPFVVLIDEWDCIFRLHPQEVEAHKIYLDFLREMLKDQEYVALACMAGILPIKKYGEHSALNMFEEFSMENAGVLAKYVGFTADEVKQLSVKYSFSYELLKEWYDGYILKANCGVGAEHKMLPEVFEIYNPISVVQAVRKNECVSYWTKTETYEALKRYIMLNMGGLKDTVIKLMSGERVKVDTQSFANDMVTFGSTDDVLTLLIHLGYLGYDSSTSEVFIPNNEIRDEFKTSIKNEADWKVIADAIKSSDETLIATWKKDEKAVAQAVEKAHFETSILQYNDENDLSYVVSLAYYTARKMYNITREFPAGKGYADMLFIPLPNYSDKPAILVELKYGSEAETALNQIKERQYIAGLKGYRGKLLLVGISYSKDVSSVDYKKHECVIEEVEI